MPTCSLVEGLDSDYVISGNKALVTLKGDALKHCRAIHSGTGYIMNYLRNGSWVCQTEILDSRRLESWSKGQAELELSTFPAVGFMTRAATGLIKAPAIKLTLTMARDVWLFLLRSDWTPSNPAVLRKHLSVSNGSEVATASLDVGEEGGITAKVTRPATGFKEVELAMVRKLEKKGTVFWPTYADTLEEPLVSPQEWGQNRATWRPKPLGTECLIAFKLNILPLQFAGLLKAAGASVDEKAREPRVFEVAFPLTDNFVFDGPGMSYVIRLKGVKSRFIHELDETPVTFPAD